MKEILKKIQLVSRNRTTHQVGLLQAKVYRILKQETNRHLAPAGLTTLHWAFLGLLFVHSKGLRLQVVAQELGVEPPFVTELAKELVKKELVIIEKDVTDSRAKVAMLSKSGTVFVKKTEAHMRECMRPMISGVSPADLITYLTVLEKIVTNAHNTKKEKNYE